jgi:hypothetical protein
MTEKTRRIARRIYKLAEDLDTESEIIYEKLEEFLNNDKTKTDLYDALECLTSTGGKSIQSHSSQIQTTSY